MEMIGVIRANPLGIDRNRWVALIQVHTNLTPVKPREGINPFTKKPTLFRAPQDSAVIVAGSKEIGSMSWNMAGVNEINVSGDKVVVEPIARDVAEKLGGQWVPSSS